MGCNFGNGNAANWPSRNLGIDLGQDRVNAQLGLFPFTKAVQQALDYGDNCATIAVKVCRPSILECQQNSKQLGAKTILLQTGHQITGHNPTRWPVWLELNHSTSCKGI